MPFTQRSLDDPVETYGSIGISPQMGVAGGILIILGLYLMTLGARMLRVTLGVVGFLTFGTLTWIGLANSRPDGGYSNDPITMITVPAGLGILGAVCYIILERITIYLIGGLGGLALALYICSWQEDHVITQDVARACFLAVLPLFMTAITFMAQHYMLIFSTAFAGSFVFIVGIDFLAHTGYLSGIKPVLDHTHQADYSITTNVYVLLSMTIALCLISCGWQYFYNRQSGMMVKRGKHSDERSDEEVMATVAAVGRGFSSHSSNAGGGSSSNGKSKNHLGNGGLGGGISNGSHGNTSSGSGFPGGENGNGFGGNTDIGGIGNAGPGMGGNHDIGLGNPAGPSIGGNGGNDIGFGHRGPSIGGNGMMENTMHNLPPHHSYPSSRFF